MTWIFSFSDQSKDKSSLWTKHQFLEHFGVFIKCTRKHMEEAITQARRDSIKSKEEKDLDSEKQNSKPEILELKHKIELIKDKFKREEEKKARLIAEYRKAIKVIDMKKNEELHNIAKDADERMIQEWQAVEYELNNLQSEEKMIQRRSEYLCREILMSEKSLRDEKLKCENRLTHFIALYDKDIGRSCWIFMSL